MVVIENRELELEFDNSEDYSADSILIALCFESRTKSHIAHLQTKSYAEHKALDEFYHQIIELTDAFAESYQGLYGIIEHFPDVEIKCDDGLRIVEITREWIDKNRDMCGSFSELQNAIDNIVSLCNSTIYKITNLK